MAAEAEGGEGAGGGDSVLVERLVAQALKQHETQQGKEARAPLVDKENVGPNRMRGGGNSGSGSGGGDGAGKGEVAVVKPLQQGAGDEAVLAARKRQLLEQCMRMIHQMEV
jgi:hypothetical protein